MTTAGRQQQLVAKYRQQLLDREAQAVHALEAAYKHVMTVIQPALDRLYDQMVEKMADGEQIPATWLYEAQRLENIKKLVSGQIDNFGSLSMHQVLSLQQFAVHLGQESAQQLLQATVPPGISYAFGLPDPSAIAAMVGATQAGTPLSDLFRGFGAEAAQAVSKALITGVTLGWNPRKVAPLVEQALGISRNRALTVSRDSLLNAYRSANLETFRANSDVVTKYRRTCSKSARTCAACIALDGMLYDLDTDFAVHPNDRCTPVPVTRDWSEILSPLGIDTSDIPDTRPQIQTGLDWFEQQDEATQRSVLGSNAAYNLYKSGIPLSDFVKHTHDENWGPGIQQKSVKQLTKAGR